MKWKKGFFFVILLSLFMWVGTALAFEPKEDQTYFIIWDSFCIMAHSPSKQFSTMIGQEPMTITLKDRKTKITISSGYLTISVPKTSLEQTRRRFILEKYTILE